MDIGCVDENLVVHRIHTPLPPPQRPRHWKPRRHAKAEEDALEIIIADMEAAGIIRKCPVGADTPYCAQVVLVRKPDMSWRVTIDYRELNEQTRPERCVMPDTTTILRSYSGCVYFSILDYVSGFWNIQMADEDIYKTRFITPSGVYEWLRMPMGLSGAPATQQRLTDHVLRDIPSANGFMDDCIAGTPTFDTHLDTIDAVLGALEVNRVKAKRSKCHFMCRKIKALGHILSEAGIEPDLGHIELINSLPAPTDAAGIGSLLGMTGYWADHVPYYAEITQPLRMLQKKGVPFVWGPNQKAAMQALKVILTSAPVLRGPDWAQPFCLTTDWSKLALGAVLSQFCIITGREYAVSYASRACTDAESRYSAHRGECKAIHWAIDKYRYYLYGRPFTVRTDHQALATMRSADYSDPAVHRWVLSVQDYDFDAQHTPGADNAVADYLSRGAGRIERALGLEPAEPWPEPLTLPPALSGRRLASAVRCARPHRETRGRSTPPLREGAEVPPALRQRSESLPARHKAIPMTTPPPPLAIEDHHRARCSLSYLTGSTSAAAALVPSAAPSLAAARITLRAMTATQPEVDVSQVCPACLSPEGHRQMLCCDGCNACWHQSCLPPPDNGIPSGDWFCPDCRPEYQQLTELYDPNTHLSLARLDPYNEACHMHDLVWADSLPGGAELHLPQMPPSEREAIRARCTSLRVHPTLRLPNGKPWLERKANGTWLLLPPLECRWNVLRLYHHRHGHCGASKLLDAITPHMTWRGMQQDAAAYVRSCDTCQRRRHLVPTPPPPELPTLLGPMESVHVDLTGRLPPTKDMKARGILKPYIMIMVDSYTKVLEVAILHDRSSDACTRAFWRYWIHRYTLPVQVVSDQGNEFLGTFHQALTDGGIDHVNTRVYHPQSNGNAERTVQTVKLWLTRMVDDHVESWPTQLDAVRSAYMRTVHRSLGMPPLQALTGLRERCLLPHPPPTAATSPPTAATSPPTAATSPPTAATTPLMAALRTPPAPSAVALRAQQVAQDRTLLRTRLRTGQIRTHERRLRQHAKQLGQSRLAEPLQIGGQALVAIPPPEKGSTVLQPTVRGPYTVQKVGTRTALLRAGDDKTFNKGLDQLTRYFSPAESCERHS